MAIYLFGLVGKSKVCGHVCTVIVEGLRNKKGKDLIPPKKIAKICDKCGIRERIEDGYAKDLLFRVKKQNEEKNI